MVEEHTDEIKALEAKVRRIRRHAHDLTDARAVKALNDYADELERGAPLDDHQRDL